jgi:hypothetical protein
MGYVTIDGARRDYGVAIDPLRLDIDGAATAQLRSAMRAGGADALATSQPAMNGVKHETRQLSPRRPNRLRCSGR